MEVGARCGAHFQLARRDLLKPEQGNENEIKEGRL